MNREGQLRLHHIGYAVKQIGPLAEIYAQRYGYEFSTPIIRDSLQTAFVQFLRLHGDQPYLEFVAPDGLDSKLTSAAKRGGGLNHLCYSCGPLEQTIAELEDSGMRLIFEPKPAVAFAGRRICWLVGEDPLPIELVERKDDDDLCTPGIAAGSESTLIQDKPFRDRRSFS
jgi:methylmalonyl-CoA/ethylmalonyl-CoA epimerase